MAVAKMQKVSICALNKHRKQILEDLQKYGCMEIDETVDSEKEFQRLDTTNAKVSIARHASNAEKALEIISTYAPRPKVKFESLKGKALLDEDVYELGAKKESEISAVIDKLIELDRDIVNLKGNIARLTNQIEELTPWMSLDVAPGFAGTGKVSFFVGTIAGQTTERQIEEEISKANPDIDKYNIAVVSASQDMTYISVAVIKSQEKDLEDALRKIGFSRPSSPVAEVPSKAKTHMEEEISSNEKEITKLLEEVSKLASNWDDIRIYSDYSRIRTKKYEVLGTLPQTKNVFAVEGYVIKDHVGTIQDRFARDYDAIVEVRDPGPDEQPPVFFKNNAFGALGEGMIESFGLPTKTEMDPSFIMMIFYIIFFGLMLSDAGYGAILAIATGVVLLKFPRMPKGTKSLIKIFFLGGISTFFWGMMFGSFFGDAVDSIATTFFGVQLTPGEQLFPVLWFVPMNEPMRLLIYALLFGWIHMFVGMFIKGYLCIKNHDIGAFVGEFLSTVLFVLGIILILLPTDMFESIAGMEFNFPPFMNTVAMAMTIIGIVLTLLFYERSSRNIGLRVGLGVYQLYNNITGWLSDFLSYSRLLALSLATGAIGSVFNKLGTMGGSTVIGVIMFILVFIIGHVLNLAINVLGAYVHSTRLQYVEFFGKFYEGGAKKFEPFYADTKYVEVKGGK